MKLAPQKLYKINEYFWNLFPTQETATFAALHAPPPRPWGAAVAAPDASWTSYWSNALMCNISFLNGGDIIMVIEVSGIQVKVINQEGKSGWINFPATQEWTKDTITEASNAP